MFIRASSMAKWSVLWMFGNLEIQHFSPALFNLGGKYIHTNSFTQGSYWGNIVSHSKREYCSQIFAQLMSNVEGNLNKNLFLYGIFLYPHQFFFCTLCSMSIFLLQISSTSC